MDNFEIAQKEARTPNAQNTDAQAKAINLRIGRLTRRLKAVNHNSACFSLQVEQMPVKGADLDVSTGCSFKTRHETLADDVFKGS